MGRISEGLENQGRVEPSTRIDRAKRFNPDALEYERERREEYIEMMFGIKSLRALQEFDSYKEYDNIRGEIIEGIGEGVGALGYDVLEDVIRYGGNNLKREYASSIQHALDKRGVNGAAGVIAAAYAHYLTVTLAIEYKRDERDAGNTHERMNSDAAMRPSLSF